MLSKGFPIFYNKKYNQNSGGYKNSYKKNIESKIDMPQFFELPSPMRILHPYNLEEAKNRLRSLPDDYFLNDLSCFQKKNFEFRNTDDNSSYKLISYSFYTSKKGGDSHLNFVHLFNSDLIKATESGTPPQELKFVSNDRKKEITIKTVVDFEKYTKNIFENVCGDSAYYKGARTLKELIYDRVCEEALNEKPRNLEFDLEIKANSINKVYYYGNSFLFDLQNPPVYKTNFMKRDQDDINFSKYEFTLFPMRNFDDEIDNLKYRRFFLKIMIDETTPEGGVNDKKKDDNLLGIEVNTIVASIQNMISKSKLEKVNFEFFRKDFFENEDDFKENFNLPTLHLSDFFNFENHPKYLSRFKFLRFIKENEKVPDIYIIKLYYVILALISENILSYFNAIELVQKILRLDDDIDYKLKIFEESNNDEYPIFLTETLTRIIDSHQGSGKEYSISEFELLMREHFLFVYNNYKCYGNEFIKSPSQNEKLIRIQRIIVTPTYTLFTPYILDQGNRIVRNFLDDPNLAMICTFRNDNINEGRWANHLLIEFIKFFLSKGINLTSNHNYRFFDYSQSQFRNMACWLVTEPEKILPLTGDYSKIKIVAKFGARISQTLTTTQKTLEIRKESIKFIDDVVKKNEKGEIEYTFSDGIGTITYPLAKKIADYLHLDNVPSAFQGRFLGCKGVWSTLYNIRDKEEICIRPSQTKFEVKIEDTQFFELCDYSRYIEAYLNRQVILLLSALGISNEIFTKKLANYRNSLEDEKYVLSLIHYEEWNRTFMNMYYSGINNSNDRLIKTLVDKNKELLYQDLKAKARIHIKEGAYVIGIMDEFGILNYGEAFLHIKKRDLDLILNKKCSVAKCPCLHPGDIRTLEFKKYIPGNEETKKYQIFEQYENVLIFPQKGKRPHPNELSGSDLDGDNYFIFYDSDLVPQRTVEPMNYNFDNIKKKTKDKITLKHVIKYFAQYTNLNNLGIIGDAHLAQSDNDPNGADGRIPRQIAEKFSRAVDAPKTGDRVELTEEEEPSKFPHFMEKKGNKNTYQSRNVLGILYDKTKQYLDELSHNDKKINNYYDETFVKKRKWEYFGLIAMLLYKEYYEEIMNILKKNEIPTESVLLTGNNIDNEASVYSKKKNNYDLRERVTNEMVELFRKFKIYFDENVNFLFRNNKIPLSETISNYYFFKNSKEYFASACYMVSYDFVEILTNYTNQIELFKERLNEMLTESVFNVNNQINLNQASIYLNDNLGLCEEEYLPMFYYDFYTQQRDTIEKIKDVLDQYEKVLIQFSKQCLKSDIPKMIDEEKQNRILSFPWCIAGDLLSNMKYNSK